VSLFELDEIVTPVVARFKKYVPLGFRRAARRYRTWVPIALAVAAVALIVAGLLNPAPPPSK
jgi:hypothetical protein